MLNYIVAKTQQILHELWTFCMSYNRCTRQTDRRHTSDVRCQTDVRQHHRLMPAPIRGEHNNEVDYTLAVCLFM